MTAESVLRALAQREGWQLDSPQAPTLARWRSDAEDLDVEIRIDGLDAVITVDGITATFDLAHCESGDDAVIRIEAETQLIAG